VSCGFTGHGSAECEGGGNAAALRERHFQRDASPRRPADSNFRATSCGVADRWAGLRSSSSTRAAKDRRGPGVRVFEELGRVTLRLKSSLGAQSAPNPRRSQNLRQAGRTRPGFTRRRSDPAAEPVRHRTGGASWDWRALKLARRSNLQCAPIRGTQTGKAGETVSTAMATFRLDCEGQGADVRPIAASLHRVDTGRRMVRAATALDATKAQLRNRDSRRVTMAPGRFV